MSLEELRLNIILSETDELIQQISTYFTLNRS